ncbi:sodium-dependent proline transporter isoform X5 [Gouania willdenowi]|uniref:sodium-dependent proline transporter isoform X5 n=1 Tax=Gouania willdenowi TaxID=441366 RepID=UPI0010556159|nr:sodium-dependent proline transporter-like isoform X5 [Gouania willdenowi]
MQGGSGGTTAPERRPGTGHEEQSSLHQNGHIVALNGHAPHAAAAALPMPQFTPPASSPAPMDTPMDTPTSSTTVLREQWEGKHEFLLSCIGYCVGLGNVWRFPYLCYRNGGGVFLIPYFLMLFVTGVPLFLMELSLGQYGSAGPITVWKCCPLLKGIGIGMLCVSVLVCLYYNVIIAWTFYYLGSSLQSPLPWSCDHVDNAAICGNASAANGSSDPLSPTEIFWNERVLGVVHSEGLHDPGPVRWQLALCLLAAWIIIFLCMMKGIRSSGKVVYVTATFPYLVLVVLVIRGATLEGSLQGVAFYLTPDWGRLANAQVWNDAASQIFYSLGIGVGGLLSMASYNKFDNNVIRDTIIITMGNCATSFFAGFAIFSVLGHMAWRKGVAVQEVADSGPGRDLLVHSHRLLQHQLRPHHHHSLHVPGHLLLLWCESVLSGHRGHDPTVPPLVPQTAALLQSMLGILHALPPAVHPDLYLHRDVQHVSPLRGLCVPSLGEGSGRVHGGHLLPADPHLGLGSPLPRNWNSERPFPEVHPPFELLERKLPEQCGPGAGGGA